MSKYVEFKLTDVEIPYVLKALREVLDQKLAQKQTLEEEIENIEANIAKLTNTDFDWVKEAYEIENFEPETVYDFSWGLVKKIHFVLYAADQLMTSKEISTIIMSIDKELGSDPKLASRITWSISKPASKGEKFDRYEDETGKHYYGLAEWFKSKGIPKDEYLNKE